MSGISEHLSQRSCQVLWRSWKIFAKIFCLKIDKIFWIFKEVESFSKRPGACQNSSEYSVLNHWPYVTLFCDALTDGCCTKGATATSFKCCRIRKHVFNKHLHYSIENTVDQNRRVDVHLAVLHPTFLSVMHQAYDTFIVLATGFPLALNKMVMQCYLVLYHEISYLSLVFSW